MHLKRSIATQKLLDKNGNMKYTKYNHIQGGTSDRSDLGKPHLEEWKEKRETKKSEKKLKAMQCLGEHN